MKGKNEKMLRRRLQTTDTSKTVTKTFGQKLPWGMRRDMGAPSDGIAALSIDPSTWDSALQKTLKVIGGTYDLAKAVVGARGPGSLTGL